MGERVKFYILILWITSCVSDTDFSVPNVICIEPELEITHTIAQVKEMVGYGIVTFESDMIIEGYVVSSDKSGNIYKEIYIQDKSKMPSDAIRIAVDKTNLYSVFPVGRKVYIKLKSLSIGYNRGALEIGKAAGSELERIPNSEVFNHFIRSCDEEEVVPNSISISKITDIHVGTLIKLNRVQFITRDLGGSYGVLNSTQTVDRLLEETNADCKLNSQINVRISGFSDFKNRELPEGKGSITGILSKYYSEYQLVLRNENDVVLGEERCAIVTLDEPTISYQQIINMYSNKVVEFGIDKDYVFEGYVTSSDQEGNFINTLFIQDAYENPKGGFCLLVDEENMFESFQVGDRVLLNLNYLYLDKIDGVYTVGVFKDDSVTEISEGEVNRYLFNSQESFEIIPRIITLEEISKEGFQNILITLNNVQLTNSELGKAYAYYSGTEDGNRVLETCGVLQELELHTLGTASFANDKFPIAKGSVTGVVYGQDLTMQIRSISDVDFQEERDSCSVVISKILITEIADPENSVGARFVELYNAGEEPLSLNGWQLNKYLNGSTTVSGSGLDLSGLTIQVGGFLILGNTEFETIFNMIPDLENSYISGNGDDVYELVDRQGEIHDVFGVVGEDGSGTSWEYLDGKAIRKFEVVEPNSKFKISEWEIFTKTTGNKQLAPENFTPKIR
ncbi:DUF5689 domain-containing protein [Flavicella sp.]|uniref:DUF5689 domain-containing protein n=1 Tax=Flavicella sp. TaxID=2957742 RepID=UPI003015F156